MKTQNRFNRLVFLRPLVAVLAAGVARAGDAATTLTFDDLSPGPDHAIIQNGYGGLHWNNFSVVNGSLRPPTEGYHTGTVSPSNVAFNSFGDPASISSSTRFDLKSAYLTAALNLDSEMQIAVQGFVGTTLLYDNTYTVDRTAPTLINFNYLGVDRVRFISSPPIQFAMDNLTVVLGPREPLPEVYIWATVPETLEPSPDTRVAPGEFTITRVGSANEPLILFLEFSGTATSGQDYQEVSQFLSMPAGARKLTVLVGPLDDSAVEGDETVIATLSPNPPINSLPNYTVHPRLNGATVVIHDNDFPNDLPVVSISGLSQVLEFCPPNADCAGISFSLRRTGPGLERPLTVFIRYHGTALADVDYPALPGLVTFEAGRDLATAISIPTDDSLYEGEETIIAEILPLVNYRVDPNRWQATTVIRDNDPPAPPVVSLELVDPVAMETPGFQNFAKWAEFRVLRTGPATEELLVFLNTRQGSARLGEDYWLERVNDGSTVRFLPGERSLNVRLFPIDDDFYEGDETVFLHLIAPPFGTPLPGQYEIDFAHSAVAMVIHDNDPFGRPVVSLELVDPEAMETLIDQNNIDWAEFRVLRTGPVTQELVVFLNTRQGSARLGEDYWLERVNNGSTVRFLPGERSVNVRLFPIDDNFYEGDETVLFHLIAPPFGTPLPGQYEIDFAHSAVAMVVHDNDPVTTRLEITAPRNGQQFQPGDIIELRAQIIGPGSGESWSIEFFDGNQRIGTTQPGGTIFWRDASGGPHVINARAYHPAGIPGQNTLDARPVNIFVGPGPAWPVVSITASGWNTAEPCPVCLVAPGVLTISRTGPATEPLTVYLEADGTATPGADYQPLPHSVTIPAETNATHLLVLPSDDQLVEGPEVVRASIARPPELATLGYLVNVHASEAFVVIGDDEAGAPEARLDIVEPQEGAQFAVGTIIQLSALGVYTRGEVFQPVEFYAGDTLIGRSFPDQPLRPFIPGLPSIHTIWWTNPPTGRHVLTARSQLSLNEWVQAPPVNITVGSTSLPVVRLETFPLQNAQAREFCPPNLDCAYPSFVVRRSGPTNADLRVYLSYSGTAAAGVDYPSLPSSITIPAGRDAEFLMLVPKDDTLVEGSESVIARFTPVPGSGYIQDPDHASATITIIDNDHATERTIVSIGTDDPIASETSILTVIDPARFRITRTGDLSRDLLVFFSVHGSATAGQDYPELNSPIRIPAGERTVTFDVTARFDQLEEGMETVYIRVEPSPLMGPMPTYDIAPTSRDAVAVILDNGSFPTPGLEIVRPEEGDRFTPPATIEIVAAAYHPTRDIGRVDFYAGAAKIGESLVVDLNPIMGGLIVHRFTWNNPPAGVHLLTARGFDGSADTLLTSKPVRITVGPEPLQPVVRIAATQRIAEESSEPFRRMNLVGEFTISRTGPTNQPLHFFVHYSGTATPGVDYPYLPWIVTIPAGAFSTTIKVIPNNDRIPEGIETLVATLSDCPPVTDPPLGVPCVVVGIDPAHQSAFVFIRDDGLTEASLVITKPSDGASLPPGETILIEATAVDLEGYISRVEFWDNETRIGESELFFFVAPDPGTPIYHRFEWRGAASGEHVLTARAVRPDGIVLRSQSVKILIRDSQPNRPPQVTIVRPVNGAGFQPNTAIEIVADTRDPDGYVRKAEFFADGRKIGEQNIEFVQPPEPGQAQTFDFTWRFPTPGLHVLTVRATDDEGATSWSSPVEIRVTVPDQSPIVSVVTRDAFAVEPASSTDLNTAAFRIRRFGPTNGELLVAYSLQGTAQNGVDYEALTGLVVIPAGQRSVNVIVRPLADNLSERIETVILRLEGTPGEQPPTYRVGHPRRAAALIGDRPMVHASGRAECLPLPDGLVNVCFAAETGQNFRVEASSDLLNWETLCDAPACDGALHFVDDEAANFPHRFYRLAPEPVTLTDE